MVAIYDETIRFNITPPKPALLPLAGHSDSGEPARTVTPELPGR
jgi:hypothetical protein